MTKVWKFGFVIFLYFSISNFYYHGETEVWRFGAGKALLKLRQRIVNDPFGALSNWIDDEGEVDPCNWFGVQCLDGRVVVL